MASGARQPFVGTYLGTGASLPITAPGFCPHEVEIFDKDATAAVVAKWVEGMPAGGGHKVVLAAAIMTAGITVTDTGFTVGTDANINESGKTYYYLVR